MGNMHFFIPKLGTYVEIGGSRSLTTNTERECQKKVMLPEELRCCASIHKQVVFDRVMAFEKDS